MDESGFSATKAFTDDMLTWVRGRGKKILIIVHDNPDPDCLASAMALRHLFNVKLNKEAVIAFSGMIGRSENLAMAKELQIPLTPFPILNLTDFHVICMLDTQPGTGNNSLPLDATVDIVIDHHPVRPESSRCRWVDIRDEYGVTATILYEYLLTQEVPISTKIATALFYAIKSETQDLGREANKPDREAYTRLFPLTNKILLYMITRPKLPVEYFLAIHTAVENTFIHGPVLTSVLGKIQFPELVAELADFLLRLENIETVLCMGLYNDELIISLRTLRIDINAGEIIKVLVDGMGSAGGHGMMAGGKIDNVTAFPGGSEKIAQLLKDKLLSILGIQALETQKLIPY